MERWRGKTAVVTGAASGIGQAITAALLRAGVNVVGLDIQQEKLTSNAREFEEQGVPAIFRPFHCDVSCEEDLDRAFTYIKNTFNYVDIMVNNAGVTNYTRIIESDVATFQRLLNINVLGVAACTARAVRSMRARNLEGHVLNVNSVLGHEIPNGFLSELDGCNGWNLYPASKHATVALTHTVRRELAAIKASIRITSISPGIVKTNITQHSSGMGDFFDKVPSLRPEDVADAVIYALGTRPEVQISELTIQCTGEV